MDIFMGLLAAVCWGATDFLVGMNAKAVGVRQAVVFGQIVGLLLMISIIGLSDEQLDKLVAAEFDTYLLSGLSGRSIAFESVRHRHHGSSSATSKFVQYCDNGVGLAGRRHALDLAGCRAADLFRWGDAGE